MNRMAQALSIGVCEPAYHFPPIQLNPVQLERLSVASRHDRPFCTAARLSPRIGHVHLPRSQGRSDPPRSLGRAFPCAIGRYWHSKRCGADRAGHPRVVRRPAGRTKTATSRADTGHRIAAVARCAGSKERIGRRPCCSDCGRLGKCFRFPRLAPASIRLAVEPCRLAGYRAGDRHGRCGPACRFEAGLRKWRRECLVVVVCGVGRRCSPRAALDGQRSHLANLGYGHCAGDAGDGCLDGSRSHVVCEKARDFVSVSPGPLELQLGRHRKNRRFRALVGCPRRTR